MSDMLVKLYQLDSLWNPVIKVSDDVCIRRAMAYEKSQVSAWVRQEFNPKWADECEIGFSRSPISTIIALKNSELVGFASHDVTCKNFFGPIGVKSQERRQNIGTSLLLTCLREMKALGYAYAIVGGVEDSTQSYYQKTVGAQAISASTPGIYPSPI